MGFFKPSSEKKTQAERAQKSVLVFSVYSHPDRFIKDGLFVDNDCHMI